MKQMNRRQFLNKSIRSAASVPLGVAALSLAPRRALGANERLNIALIGCGGRGRYVARGIRELGAEISFLCDLHEGRLAEAAKFLARVQDREPKPVKDMREVFDAKDVDAVIMLFLARNMAHKFGEFIFQAGNHIFELGNAVVFFAQPIQHALNLRLHS